MPQPPDDEVDGAVPKTTKGSPKEALYRRFWARFVPVAQQRGWTKATATTQNWFQMPAGTSGVNWVVSFTRFGCRSELYFGDPDPATNLSRWRLLADRRDEITKRFGEDLIFADLPSRKGCRIETRLLGPTIDDEDHWSDVLRWMEDTQERLRTAIGDVPVVKEFAGTSPDPDGDH
ncbi:DUF4268 domain-containing protein [Amycolatopsis sp. SID8362]|uniref:DUF4268 domain-containing protein n=1 Tax=Amycolatopsis sp. SID8362 TaxID=2690346 RepID=UPI001370EC97|nr:DUF4268 domain-containing protein [Amycolatopsis sp. SID8362]NBH12432.1 DUF4268 domain-containing protein [Amycolatopsis sp. SID8362]NED49124.1 DUF4268 domain-containing protein [Amycolatopsis sp. SID8362]